MLASGVPTDAKRSYAEVAEIMRKVADVIKVVADEFDPSMGQKADEHCELMSQMGVAIEIGDEIKLAALVKDLERKPGL